MADDIKVKIGGDASGLERAAKQAENSGKQSAEEIKKGLSAAGGAAGELGNRLMEAATSPLTALTAGVLSVAAAITKMFDIFEQRIKRAADIARQEASMRDDQNSREETRLKELLNFYKSEQDKIDQRSEARWKKTEELNAKYNISDEAKASNFRAVNEANRQEQDVLDAKLAQALKLEFGIELKKDFKDGYAYGGTDMESVLQDRLTAVRKRQSAALVQDIIAQATEIEHAMSDNSWGGMLNNAFTAEDLKAFNLTHDPTQLIGVIDKILADSSDMQQLINSGRYDKLTEIRANLKELHQKQLAMDAEDKQRQTELVSVDMSKDFDRDFEQAVKMYDADAARRKSTADKINAAAAAEKKAADERTKAEQKRAEDLAKSQSLYEATLAALKKEAERADHIAKHGEEAGRIFAEEQSFREKFGAILEKGSAEEKAIYKKLLAARLDAIREGFTGGSLPGISSAVGSDAITRVGGYLGRSVRSTSEMLLEKQVNYQKQIAENTLKTANRKRTF